MGAAPCVIGERVRRRGLAAGVLGDDYEESEDMDGWGGGGEGATKMCGVRGETKRWGRNHGRGGENRCRR